MNRPSVEQRVARQGVVVVVGSLLFMGLGTGAALVVQARRDLDAALLTAAHGHAHPDVAGWEVEHSRSPVDTWVVARGDPRVPMEAVNVALDEERPTVVDVGDQRLLLLPAETGVDGEEQHMLIAASAPRVLAREVLGPFVLVYGGLGLLVAGLASLTLSRVVRASFRPLDQARAEIEALIGLGQGVRLSEQAPVELESLLRSINGLLGRLEAAWAAQSRFTAEAAHELRTPVTSLLGELDVVLRRERDAPTYRAALQSAREEAHRLRRIVEALTSFTRLDAGEAEQARVPSRAGEIAAAALSAERAGVLAHGGTVDVEIEADPELEVNVSLLELAVGNLLRNAGRHAPGARVLLRVTREGGAVRFAVHDAGPGVPPSEWESVFSRFTRGMRARAADPNGLGLGLAFAREVARRHGGDSRVERSPLGGALVWLEVPVRSA